MRVIDVIKQAQTGELSDLSIKDDIEAIIQFINIGLIALYGRFSLKTSEITITPSKAPDENATYERISSSEYKLPEGAGAVLGAFLHDGTDLSINDESDPNSVLTPTWNTIQIPTNPAGGTVTIVFLSDPDLITGYVNEPKGTDAEISAIKTNNESILNSTIPIPSSLIEPLLHYIGYRAHGSVIDGVSAESSVHLKRFNESCDDVMNRGLITVDKTPIKNNLQRKGFA